MLADFVSCDAHTQFVNDANGLVSDDHGRRDRSAGNTAGVRDGAAEGTLSSLGLNSGKLSVPLEPFAMGLGDHGIVTTLCPGGKVKVAIKP